MLTLKEILLEAASKKDIYNAIDKKKQIYVNYVSPDNEVASGKRIIEVYAFGISKAGNYVIRAFQPYGDTVRGVPNWKLFRVDGFKKWTPLTRGFITPPEKRFSNIEPYNPHGDKTMYAVYHQIQFPIDDNEKELYVKDTVNNTNINNKEDANNRSKEIYKTPYEKEEKSKLDSIKKQLENPKFINDTFREKAQKELEKPQEEEINDTNSEETDEYPNIIGNADEEQMKEIERSQREKEEKLRKLGKDKFGRKIV